MEDMDEFPPAPPQPEALRASRIREIEDARIALRHLIVGATACMEEAAAMRILNQAQYPLSALNFAGVMILDDN